MQNPDEVKCSLGRGDDLEDRLLDFSARIGKVFDSLPNTRLGRHFAGQLVRSGTSPAPNDVEACAAEACAAEACAVEACAVESKKDFVHKATVFSCWIGGPPPQNTLHFSIFIFTFSISYF